MTTQQWTEERQANRVTGHQFESSVIGDQLEITVAIPLTYNEWSDPPLPAIYVLDPMLTFDMVMGFTRLFATLSGGAFPQTLVVGVGYPTRQLSESTERRIRDFTPTLADFPPEIPGDVPKYGVGGAPKLLESLATEIIPGIQTRYQVHPTDRMLIGWSLGGLFGLYSLFHQPDTFSRYLLVSPSIWWDATVAFSFEQAYANVHKDLSASVFLCVGEREETYEGAWRNEFLSDDGVQKLKMVSNLAEMAKRLKSRAYPNLNLKHRVIPNEYHLTVFPAALSQGLTYLFQA
jgi:predicted alpha/beta superfamily hydrolase